MKEERHQDPRHDAGHEELADGLLRHDRVDDEDRAGRDQDPEAAAGGDDTRCQRQVVVVLLHLRQGHRGHGGGRGALEPQMAENPAQAPMVAMASPPGRVPRNR